MLTVDNRNQGAAVSPRSSGALTTRREALDWPADREFRILSIDGGGIRGIFPASVLAELEARYLGGAAIGPYFDLIVGSSTGGIIAIGLGASLSAADILPLYRDDGRDIFPSPDSPTDWLKSKRRWLMRKYDRDKLEERLRMILGAKTLGDSSSRLCIPSCDGTHGDIWVFKTPHHPDFRKDRDKSLVEVALATSAAPTYFRPLEQGGYRLLDGGVWANNPIMVGLVEALSSFAVPREQIRIFSIGCGARSYEVGWRKMRIGGMWHWRDIMFGAMSYQSHAALGQARLLIGAEQVTRIEPPPSAAAIGLDDWKRASAELPAAAVRAVDEYGDAVAASFLDRLAERYCPVLPVDVHSGDGDGQTGNQDHTS